MLVYYYCCSLHESIALVIFDKPKTEHDTFAIYFSGHLVAACVDTWRNEYRATPLSVTDKG